MGVTGTSFMRLKPLNIKESSDSRRGAVHPPASLPPPWNPELSGHQPTMQYREEVTAAQK